MNKKAFTLTEILAAVVIMAVLVVGVFMYVSNYTTWGKKESGKRTVRLLNDALSRYKPMAPPQNFSILYEAESKNPALVGNPAHSTFQNKLVVQALIDGFTVDGVENRFLSSQNINFDQLSSTGDGDNFWFTEYGAGLTNAELPTEITLTAYRHQPFRYTVVAERSKPLSFSGIIAVPADFAFLIHPITGEITGTPSTLGQYKFTINFSDGSATYARNITLNVVEGTPIIVSPDSAIFYTGIPATYDVAAGAGNSPQYFFMSPSVDGFVIDEHSGLMTVNAVPSDSTNSEWTFLLTVRATNSVGSSDKVINVTVRLSVPTITSENKLTVLTGHPISFQLTSNTPAKYTGTVLPALTLSESGLLTGTLPPTSVGTYEFDFVATNPAGSSNPQHFTLTVVNPANPKASIIPASL